MTTNDLNGYGFAVPAVMHHYTSAEGLQGILNNRALWLSDIGFLNDESEMRYALEQARDGFDENVERLRADPNGTPGTSWIAEVLGDASDNIAQQLRSQGTESPWRQDYYAASFCTAPSLLSMWRGYAASASGFSIAFDRHVLMSAFSDSPDARELEAAQVEELKECNRKLRGEIDEVSYGLNTRATMRLNKAYHLAMNKVVGRDLDEVRKDKTWVDDLGSEIEAVCTFIKHPDFDEEKEVRLLVRSATDVPLVPSLRSGPANLVPYVTMKFSPRAIIAIEVGPSRYRERSGRALRKFLDLHNGGEFAHVKVTVSGTPLV